MAVVSSRDMTALLAAALQRDPYPSEVAALQRHADTRGPASALEHFLPAVRVPSARGTGEVTLQCVDLLRRAQAELDRRGLATDADRREAEDLIQRALACRAVRRRRASA